VNSQKFIGSEVETLVKIKMLN